ncbi:MAG: hypothetical protein ACR2NR_05200 [Solirubrobacteraceae bacterium]
MSPAPVCVVLIGGPSPCVTGREALAPLLGPERCQELERLLRDRARSWAASVAADGAVHVTERGGSQLRDCVVDLFASGPGPVLVAWPELTAWRPQHADGPVADLADGCDVSFGPMFDGGFYLVALSRPLASLLALDDDGWNGPDPIGLAVAAAREAGQGIGLLRAERGLRTRADVRALLADPLLDEELRGLLSVS